MLTHDNKILGFNEGHRWLSNFTLCHVMLDGVTYKSTEHAYQAAKTIIPAERAKMWSLDLPVHAKGYGKKVTMREDWCDELKLNIMVDLNKQKYNQPKFKELLLATGDAYIEETNYWNDTFWGVCRGKGKNHLGTIIMNIREELKNELQ
jgi:ribA/ribD-fused uncharacterized protein